MGRCKVVVKLVVVIATNRIAKAVVDRLDLQVAVDIRLSGITVAANITTNTMATSITTGTNTMVVDIVAADIAMVDIQVAKAASNFAVEFRVRSVQIKFCFKTLFQILD